MVEKIIPEKEPLFQPKNRIQKKEKIQPPAKPVKQKPRPIQPVKEEPPVQFNIPQTSQTQQQPQIIQQTEPHPNKEISLWRKLGIAVAVILLVIGLGIYFLAG